MVGRADERRCVLGAVHEVHLEAIQVLDGDRHVECRRVLRRSVQMLRGTFALLAGRRGSAEDAQRGGERAAQCPGAEYGACLEGRLRAA